MITRKPFESELQSRMALGQQRLQQEYAQSQQLIDLLALQKLSKEKAEAARSIQASMQTNPATVKDQLEQQLMTSNRQGIAAMMPGIQIQGQRMAQAQARPAAGIPSQPAPNMARMAGGGIVAFQEGGDVAAVREYIRLREKLKDPNITPEAAQTISIMLEDMKRQAQDPSRFIRDVETSSGFDPAKEYEESMQEQGMYGGGIVGYDPGGFVGPTQDMMEDEEDTVRLTRRGRRGPRQARTEDGTNGFLDFMRRYGAGQLRTMAGESTPLASQEQTKVLERIMATPDEGFGIEMRQDEEVPESTESTSPIAPDEEMLALYAQEDARVRREREEKPKRQVDYDLLRKFLLGGAGATSIAGALAGGGRGVGEELRRREARDIEQANLQADRDLRQLALDYELNAANAKILADNKNVLTNAQMEIAAETLKGIEAGTNMAYIRAVEALEDEYEGEILEKKIAQLKQDTIRSAVSVATSLGSVPTTGSQQFSSFEAVGS